jgi:hypothetical protein
MFPVDNLKKPHPGHCQRGGPVSRMQLQRRSGGFDESRLGLGIPRRGNGLVL